MSRRDLSSNNLKRLSKLSILAQNIEASDKPHVIDVETPDNIEETNVKELPDIVKNSIIYLTDDMLLDDPLNQEYYGSLEVNELSAAMKRDGFQGVILAYPTESGKYMIESGHRRRAAARKAGIEKYPVIPTAPPVQEYERIFRLIGANLHNRAPLSPLRIAKIAETLFQAHQEKLKDLKKNGLLEEGGFTYAGDYVAQDLEMSSKNIDKYRRLLKLIPELQELADSPLYPWSYLAEASNLPTEKQQELAAVIKEKDVTADSSSTWIKTLISDYKSNMLIEEANSKDIQTSKNSADTNKTKIRRKNGTKLIMKGFQSLNEGLTGDVLIKEKDVPDIIKTLEELNLTISEKINELKKADIERESN